MIQEIVIPCLTSEHTARRKTTTGDIHFTPSISDKQTHAHTHTEPGTVMPLFGKYAQWIFHPGLWRASKLVMRGQKREREKENRKKKKKQIFLVAAVVGHGANRAANGRNANMASHHITAGHGPSREANDTQNQEFQANMASHLTAGHGSLHHSSSHEANDVPSPSKNQEFQGNKFRRMSRIMKNNLQEFLGVGEESERQALRWEHRRKRYAGSIGHLKDKYIKPGEDDVDGSHRMIVDPLRRPSGTSSSSLRSSMILRKPSRKESVATMTFKGITNLVQSRKKSRRATKGRSIAEDEGAAETSGVDGFSLVDDVFYDDTVESASRPVPKARATPLEKAPAPGWYRRPPQALPSTPGTDFVDRPDFGLGRITKKVLDSAMRRDKRTVGIGVMGRFFRPSIRGSIFFSKDVKIQIDEMDDHRPYFTYWASFVQIIVFIVAVAVYGTAPFGFSKSAESRVVRMSNLAREIQSHVEIENIWFGPRQADLIHLGAKYSPCMRSDLHLQESIRLDREEEKESACCVRNDGSGCVQRVQSSCGTLSTWKKWTVSKPGPDSRSSGSVCGQDPTYCITPASAAPFVWPDNIVEWPICTNTKKPNQSQASSRDRHMSCEILGRPCCHGVQGECIITTREHCDLKRGFFHDEAALCSQVNCFEEICGMIPFSRKDKPDQFYRLWTSLFLHGGLVHLIVSVVFQMWIMRDLEKLIGAIRLSIIYIGSGVVGNLASCVFLPYQVEAGPSGSQFGVMACLLVEMLQSYQMYRRPGLAIMKLVTPILILFFFGLLPWFDNWAHLFGFGFGFLLAFALMPYVSFGKFDRRRKLISVLVALGSAFGLFMLLILLFYIVPLTECSACQYFNCIPFTATFCENMQVSLKKNSTYSAI